MSTPRTGVFLRTAILALSLPFSAMASDGLIQDQYIIELAAPVSGDVAATAATLLDSVGGGALLHTYSTVLQGFSARIDADQAKLLSVNPLVKLVEQDREVVASTTQNNAVWGIDRIDQADLPLDGTYTYPNHGGSGANVYVIDTGINPDHQEFTGRVGTSQNFVADSIIFAADPSNWQDCAGHGTHVSSTSTGTRWGVAKQATVHAVRVLDCFGSGNGSDIIAGIDWVANNAELPAVVNMSLGTVGGRSTAQEDAVRGLYNAGILPIVAAGNDTADACTTSPAAEPTAVTVAATDNDDSQASYSNFGTCVDLYAPGTNVVAADYNSNTASTTMSGTSMATPHVAGAAALLLAAQPNLSPAELTQALLANTVSGKVGSISAGSPNLLLQVADGGGTPPVDQPPTAAFSTSCTDLSCTFDASSSSDDNGIASYAWTLGDGSQAAGSQVSHDYAADGDYTVTLTVTDTAGQTDSHSDTASVAAGSTGGGNGTTYTGTLSGSNDSAIHPDGGFDYAGGLITGELTGPAGTDFDLRLQSYSCFFVCSWGNVASATTTSSHETISYNASAGTYRWVVESYSGAGDYTLVADPQ